MAAHKTRQQLYAQETNHAPLSVGTRPMTLLDQKSRLQCVTMLPWRLTLPMVCAPETTTLKFVFLIGVTSLHSISAQYVQYNAATS